MDKTEENKKINLKIFPVYKAISSELLFFYAISFIFLTQVKHINPADVLLAETFFPIFKSVLLIPLTMAIEKLGEKKSLIFANLINAVSVFIYMIATNSRIFNSFAILFSNSV